MGKNERNLYKFFSFNWHKNESGDDFSYVIDGISEKYLFCQDIHMLNDAFENKAVLCCELPKSNKDFKSKKKIFLSFVKKLNRADNIGPKISVKSVKECNEKEFDGIIKKMAEYYKESLNAKDRLGVNICCFSKEKSHLLMWGHYADGMKGVCIKYNFENKNLYDVSYSNEMNEVNIWDHFSGNAKYIDKLHASKGVAWEYEKEVRLVITEDKGNRVYFEESNVKEVIFGCKAKEKDVSAVFNAISDWEVKPLFKIAFPGDKDFKVEFKSFDNQYEIIDFLKEYDSSRQIAGFIKFC